MARRRLRERPGSAEHVEAEAREVERTFRRKRTEAHESLTEAIRPLHGRPRRGQRNESTSK